MLFFQVCGIFFLLLKKKKYGSCSYRAFNAHIPIHIWLLFISYATDCAISAYPIACNKFRMNDWFTGQRQMSLEDMWLHTYIYIQQLQPGNAMQIAPNNAKFMHLTCDKYCLHFTQPLVHTHKHTHIYTQQTYTHIPHTHLLFEGKCVWQINYEPLPNYSCVEQVTPMQRYKYLSPIAYHYTKMSRVNCSFLVG